MTFVTPWLLTGLALLPVLWWLLRVAPPAPRWQRFPPLALLRGLEAREDEAARTPPWILALRLLLAATILLAAAHPVIEAEPMPAGRGPLLVVVDDGWAAAPDWPARQTWMDNVAARAGREGRPVLVLPTAPPADGTPVAVHGPLPAAEARAVLQALAPKPWGVDRGQAAAVAAAISADGPVEVEWLADGVDDGHGAALAQTLQRLGGGVEMVTGGIAHVLLPPAADAVPTRIPLSLRRSGGGPEPVVVRALDDKGQVLARAAGDFATGAGAAGLTLTLPVDLRNRLARLDIENEAGAAAVVLLDETWQRRPVGLAAGGGEAAASPLLDKLGYVDKALAPTADLRRGEPADLLAAHPAVLVLADFPAVPSALEQPLAAWINGGGILIRFAGPALARAAAGGTPDPFLPVPLRGGGRSLGGAMSWTRPAALAPFPESSPFAGLAVPADVTVATQVLAEPSLELDGHTWARLDDGTPLVTAARRGRGWVVLVHTSANAEWTNLPLSGLFPEMLQRLVGLAAGRPGRAEGPLAPLALLDGRGRLGPPAGAATAITGPEEVPGPRHPPGLYGREGGHVALNLGPSLGPLSPLAVPAGVRRATLEGRAPDRDLQPPLLAAAVVLAALDLLAALGLRGLLRGAAVLAVVLAAPAARADDFAIAAGLQTRLAYVRTGDAAVDAKSRAGLHGLSQAVAHRSTLVPGEPMGVDIESEPVLFFPLLYWPVTAAQHPPSAAAAERVGAYMRHGGLVVFDSGDGDPLALAELARGLGLPPLAPVTPDHVLARSFYLLTDMPGRIGSQPVWVEDTAAGDNDGVSPVVVGAADWAGAWAVDPAGKPMFPVEGGEGARELARRFGVNLVMYALTGNYKADQVHLPAIMERLGK